MCVSWFIFCFSTCLHFIPVHSGLHVGEWWVFHPDRSDCSRFSHPKILNLYCASCTHICLFCPLTITGLCFLGIFLLCWILVSPYVHYTQLISNLIFGNRTCMSLSIIISFYLNSSYILFFFLFCFCSIVFISLLLFLFTQLLIIPWSFTNWMLWCSCYCLFNRRSLCQTVQALGGFSPTFLLILIIACYHL